MSQTRCDTASLEKQRHKGMNLFLESDSFMLLLSNCRPLRKPADHREARFQGGASA